MKVSVTRSGGIAGLSTTWVVTIDDRPDRDEWLSLVEQVQSRRPPQRAATPDRYVYIIRWSRRRVTLPEQQLTGPWRELVDRVCDEGERLPPRRSRTPEEPQAPENGEPENGPQE